MRVAIIGTRKPSAYQYDILKAFSISLAKKGIEISSGGADGSDTAAQEGCCCVDPKLMHIFLPDNKKVNRINKDCNIYVYNKAKHIKWTESVRKYHPSKGNLPPYYFSLHARNYGIVADPKPVDAVIALPKDLNSWGGTGQGMRIAIDLNIKLFNLLLPGIFEEALDWIDSFREWDDLFCPICNWNLKGVKPHRYCTHCE